MKMPPWFHENMRVLVPGAGRGHDAVFLESCGYSVVALDSSAIAKEEFHKLYPQSKVDYRVCDYFKFVQTNTEKFDAFFEHTFFCALSPHLRFDYVKSLLSLLKKEGTFFGIFFKDMWKSGPPFGSTQWEIRELFKDNFNIRLWQLSSHSIKSRLGLELLTVMSLS
jgi:hypothetical protein